MNGEFLLLLEREKLIVFFRVVTIVSCGFFLVLAWGSLVGSGIHGFCQEKKSPQKKSVELFVSPPASLFVCVSSYLLCSPFSVGAVMDDQPVWIFRGSVVAKRLDLISDTW